MNDRVRRVHCSNGFREFDSHTTTMNKLTEIEIDSIKELIYSEIDKRGGFENLNDELKLVLTKLQKKSIPIESDYVEIITN